MMKKTIMVVMLIVMFVCCLTGCGQQYRAKEIEALEIADVEVDVSKIVEKKEILEKRVASTDLQKKIKSRMIHAVERVEESGVTSFKVHFSKELLGSWEECNDYAQNVDLGKSYLGSSDYYYLWLVQRLLNKEVTWAETCDDDTLPLPTIAFDDKFRWIGQCTKECSMGGYNHSTLGFLHKNKNHAWQEHTKWQAFVVTVN